MRQKLSFNKLSKVCKSHIQDDLKRCFCDITGHNCRKDFCPKLNGEENELR